MTSAKGFIYVLHNPSLRDDYLKIGLTKRSPYTRAKELSAKTGVAQEYVVAYWQHVMDTITAESAIHKYLAKYRVNESREFFRLPMHEAILAVRRIAYDQARIEQWSENRVLGKAESVRWLCLARDLFLFTRYQSIFHSRPDIIDVWEARDDNDELLITSDPELDPGSLAPETWTAEDSVFRTGDRITWISRSRDGVLSEPPPQIAHIEFSGPTRVVGLSVRPRISPERVPVLFSMLSPSASHSAAHAGYEAVQRLGTPRSWSPDEDLTTVRWKKPGWFTCEGN